MTIKEWERTFDSNICCIHCTYLLATSDAVGCGTYSQGKLLDARLTLLHTLCKVGACGKHVRGSTVTLLPPGSKTLAPVQQPVASFTHQL